MNQGAAVISLLKPFAQLRSLAPKRKRKTPGALYRILSHEFESARPDECSCKMPMIVMCERGSPIETNWRVYQHWCNSPECQRAVSEVVARNSKLFELIELGDDCREPVSTLGAGL